MDQKILYKFFKGRTTEEEGLAIKYWIEQDVENERMFLEQRKLYDSLTLLKSENDLQQYLSQNVEERPKRRVIFFRELLKISAVAAIAFLIAYFFMPSTELAKYTAMQTITVPAGQRVNISLPDGTNVWLNARTTIQYPVSFNNEVRSVKLDGQAYFDVTHDEEMPFVVETDKGKIRVLGTKFDILSYSKSDEFETALMDGSVEVSLNSHPEQKIILSPDTKAYLADGKLYKTSITDQNPYRWKEGLISFVDISFADIMKEFEKSYGIEIVIQNKIVQKYSYTGKFRIADGIEHALRVLQKDLKNFTFNRDSDNNILYIK